MEVRDSRLPCSPGEQRGGERAAGEVQKFCSTCWLAFGDAGFPCRTKCPSFGGLIIIRANIGIVDF